ncbi:MAG: guanylate kinase [bacterium]
MARSRPTSQSPVMRRGAGFPLVVSSPSGAGKTSVCRAVAREMKNVSFSVSLTTRSPRRGEKNGKDYVFVDEGRFRQLVDAGELAEWAVVYGSYYGTPKKVLEENLDKGRCVILTLDHNGGESIKKNYPGAVLVYLLPPSMKELQRRLRGRHTDCDSAISGRLKSARRELAHAKDYDYLVVNKRLNRTVNILKAIISAESHRRERFGKISFK